MDAEIRSDVPAARLVDGAAADNWAGFSEVWQVGFERIYTIRLTRSRLRADTSNESFTRRPVNILRWLGLSYGPAFVTSGILLSDSSWWSQPQRAVLPFVLGTINAGAFASAALAWGYALKRAHTVDDLLRPCRTRDRVVGVIGRAVDHKRQAPLPLLLALLPWLISAVAGDYAKPGALAFVLLLINISWTLALTANDTYWLLVPPLIAIRIRACRDIRLRWNDPAYTEGIRTLSEGFAFPAIFLALGALAVTIPSLTHHAIFGAYLPYLFAWLLIASLWNGVLTQLCLYSVIRRFKLRVLDEIAAESSLLLPLDRATELRRHLGAKTQLADRLSVYSMVSSAPALPLGTGTIVQYVAALMGSVVGFILQSSHI